MHSFSNHLDVPVQDFLQSRASKTTLPFYRVRTATTLGKCLHHFGEARAMIHRDYIDLWSGWEDVLHDDYLNQVPSEYTSYPVYMGFQPRSLQVYVRPSFWAASDPHIEEKLRHYALLNKIAPGFIVIHEPK